MKVLIKTSSGGEKHEKNLKINDSFIVNALRNCGYNNYSALAGIIENSLEPEVSSTYVKVNFETKGTNSFWMKIFSMKDRKIPGLLESRDCFLPFNKVVPVVDERDFHSFIVVHFPPS